MEMPQHLQRIPQRGFRRRERTPLTALSSSEAIDASFRLYRQGGLALLRSLVFPAAIAYGMFALSWHFIAEQLFVTHTNGSVMEEAQELILLISVGTLCAAPVVICAFTYMTAFVSLYASQMYFGMRPNGAAIANIVLSNLLKLTGLSLLILVNLLATLIVSFGLLLLSAIVSEASRDTDTIAPLLSLFAVIALIVSPVVFMFSYVRIGLAPVVMVNEGGGIRQAIRRSKELMRAQPNPQSGTAIGLIFLSLLIFLIFLAGMRLPFSIIEEYIATSGVATTNQLMQSLYAVIYSLDVFLAFLLILPVLVCGQTMIYFDRRVRIEGLDIELLAQEVWKRGRQVDFDV